MKKIINEHAVVDEVMMEKFRAMRDVYSLSCLLTDAQERDNVMRSTIVQRTVNKRIIGPALTVKLTTGDIVDMLDIFEVAKPGDVVVVDAFSEESTSVWGGLITGLALAAGIEGAVIDGSTRDTDEAKMLNFPVYAHAVSPREAHTALSGKKEPIEINTPVVCGGIIVNPGDLVIADEVGISIAPSDKLEEIYERVVDQADKEEQARKAILEGATVDELLARFGRI